MLLVRLSAVGDCIQTMPLACAVREQWPEAHLTWVVESRWRPLLEDNPFIDRIVELHRGSVGGVLETMRELRGASYDFAVDFQGLIKSAVTARAPPCA